MSSLIMNTYEASTNENTLILKGKHAFLFPFFLIIWNEWIKKIHHFYQALIKITGEDYKRFTNFVLLTYILQIIKTKPIELNTINKLKYLSLSNQASIL